MIVPPIHLTELSWHEISFFGIFFAYPSFSPLAMGRSVGSYMRSFNEYMSVRFPPGPRFIPQYYGLSLSHPLPPSLSLSLSLSIAHSLSLSFSLSLSLFPYSIQRSICRREGRWSIACVWCIIIRNTLRPHSRTQPVKSHTQTTLTHPHAYTHTTLSHTRARARAPRVYFSHSFILFFSPCLSPPSSLSLSLSLSRPCL